MSSSAISTGAMAIEVNPRRPLACTDVTDSSSFRRFVIPGLKLTSCYISKCVFMGPLTRWLLLTATFYLISGVCYTAKTFLAQQKGGV